MLVPSYICKVGHTNLQVMWTDEWVMCAQDSQKVCTKLLSLPDNEILSPSAKIKFFTRSKAPPSVWPHQHTQNKTSGNFMYAYIKFPLVLFCVCWCGQTEGGALERVKNFILAEGLRISLSGRESSLVQTFCESCAHITHSSVHMTWRFVCPTLHM